MLDEILLLGVLNMGYREKYLKNKKDLVIGGDDGQTFKFTEKNNMVIGKFIRQQTYKKDIFSKKSEIYFFDTDEGPKAFFLGGVTDKRIGKSLIPGQIYSVESLGKKKTGRGREMNMFRITHILDEPAKKTSRRVVRKHLNFKSKPIKQEQQKINHIKPLPENIDKRIGKQKRTSKPKTK